MGIFDNNEFEYYKALAKEKWGNTEAYKEHSEKTKNYSKNKWDSLSVEMDNIFKEFATYMKKGAKHDSTEVQEIVEMLQKHITENYYICTTEILAGLGQMYVGDERFKNNIDKHAEGTAGFVCKAIEIYCKK